MTRQRCARVDHRRRNLLLGEELAHWCLRRRGQIVARQGRRPVLRGRWVCGWLLVEEGAGSRQHLGAHSPRIELVQGAERKAQRPQRAPTDVSATRPAHAERRVN